MARRRDFRYHVVYSQEPEATPVTLMASIVCVHAGKHGLVVGTGTGDDAKGTNVSTGWGTIRISHSQLFRERVRSEWGTARISYIQLIIERHDDFMLMCMISC